MSMLFFTFRAQLKAQKALGRLRQHGIPARLGKTPGTLALNGCGYGLWVPVDLGIRASEILKTTELRFEKSYRMEDGCFKEVLI